MKTSLVSVSFYLYDGRKISHAASSFPDSLLLLFNQLMLSHQEFFRAIHINIEIIKPGAGFKIH